MIGTARPATPAKAPRKRPGRFRGWKIHFRGWKFYAALAICLPVMFACGLMSYYYVVFSRMIDARIHGEMQRVDPRVFARPFELQRGQSVSPHQLVDRLNDLGYSHRERPEEPGQFTVGRNTLLLIPRDGDHKGEMVRVVFGSRGKTVEPHGIERLELPATKKNEDRIRLDAPLITALITTSRSKRRDVPLQVIPTKMVQAVLAIEDRRFYDHHGIDPIGIAGAVFRNVFGNKEYLASGSTITQQLVKNTFLTSEKTLRAQDDRMVHVDPARAPALTKDQILELYLNDVALGQRGSFAIHGVAEAARLFFAKDITNVSLTEAATIAGVIQSPSRLSPFNNGDRAKERRNVVLRTMVESGFISDDAATRAAKEPLLMAARALESEAPYFVDFISQELQDKYKSLGTVDVYTTLDLHLQRLAQDSLRDGLTRVDELLKRRRRRAEAALIAVDPRNGEVLAFVGGRSYNQSQYNRAVSARRQPGSVFKPFVYLAAFERAYADGRTDVTPATLVQDEPTAFTFNEQTWSPNNYEGEYDGPITLRRALALSRNIATVKVAEAAGYDEVAALVEARWRRARRHGRIRRLPRRVRGEPL